MKLKKVFGYLIVVVVFVVIGLGVPGVFWMPEDGPALYLNDMYGISFSYPESYDVEEREVGNGERAHHVITMTGKQSSVGILHASEGPPALSIDIYQNNLDNLGVEQWIRNTAFSNFKLSADQRLLTISVGGVPGLYYRWDGLYQGESIALAHKGNIIVFTATFNALDDQIRKDFGKILGSLVLK